MSSLLLPINARRGLTLAFAGKPLEVGNYGGNQFLSSRILGSGRGREEIEKVARFITGVMPIHGGRREQLRFQFILPDPQLLLVGFDVERRRRNSVAFCAAIPRC